MAVRTCPGLPADWVNAWLAAVGVCVLVPEMRLSWTDAPVPVAVLHHPADPEEALIARWPDEERLAAMPIAADDEVPGEGQRVSVATFAARARRARRSPDSWALSSTCTDLVVDETGTLARSFFDAPAPGPAGPIHQRAAKQLTHLDDLGSRLAATLDGAARPWGDNGLGFDARRIGGLADSTDKRTNPVIELLAFFGLAVLAVRGPGVEGKRAHRMLRQRGVSSGPSGRSFSYPTWRSPLSRQGIDALLDLWESAEGGRRALLGVSSTWRTVTYEPRGQEPTTGFTSVPR